MSSRGECGGEGCVLTGGVVTLSWWFSGGLASASLSSGISSSLMQEKNTVGRAIALSLPSTTLCIYSSSLMCPTRSSVLSVLVGELLSDSTSSESPSLSPILDTDVTSLSRLTGGLGDAV